MTDRTWSKSGGYGWIKPDSGGDRVYVHKSAVTRRNADQAASLELGERVDYQIGSRPGGSAAINVKVIAAQPASEG